VGVAADVIQPDCRHYAGVAIVDGVLSTACEKCNRN
jgi:hypothetical protein